jgi:hypothetical protein
MEAQLSWLAIILAAISSLVIGAIWYAPFAFGKQWQKLAKLSDKEIKNGSSASMVIAAIGGLLTAYVVAHITFISAQFYTNVSFLMSGVFTGFFLWLGIAATTLAIHDGFELKPPKLTLIKITSQLVTLLVMGVIIGLLPPA